MRVLVTGAAGMIGRRLCEALLRARALGEAPLTGLTAFDVVPADLPADPLLRVQTGDIADPATAPALTKDRPEVVVHLAAVVSGEAEADFDKGYRINLDGTRQLWEAIRHADHCPRVVYASSIGVFGVPLPEEIGDEVTPLPLTSYGTQKLIGELLLNDYTRKGFFDGVGIRLPTIVVRPGAPNRAASGFFSGIIREPLAGQEALLPVDDEVRHWMASPDAAVGFLLHAATMDAARLGTNRCLTMPGLAATVGEMLAALGRVAGPEAVARVRRQPDEAVRAIVHGWPQAFAPQRALAAGFRADASFDEIIRAHIRDTKGRP